MNPFAGPGDSASANPLAFLHSESAASPAGTLEDTAALAPASFGQRLGAHLIDQAAILAAAWFVGRPIGSMLGGFFLATGSPFAAEAMSYAGALLVAAFTSFVFEVFWIGSYLQATPGKRALRLKVTNLRGRPIGFGHAFGRYLMKGLSGSVFCIGFLIQPFTERKQALHDLLAGTLVLRG